MCIYIILFLVCIFLFILIGQFITKEESLNNGEKFNSLYNLVPQDNLYEFVDATKVLQIINGKTGVILMGFHQNEWMNMYAFILDREAKLAGIDKIYYYDFHKDRDESNGTYETIVNKLKVYAPVNDEGLQDLWAPTVVIVKNGEVIAYFDEVSFMKGTVTPEIYYTEDKINEISLTFNSALKRLSE